MRQSNKEKAIVRSKGIREGSSCNRTNPTIGHEGKDLPCELRSEVLQTLLEKTPFGLLVLDRHGKWLYSNPQLASITGYGPERPGSSRQWIRQAFPNTLLRHQFLDTWRRRDTTATVDRHYRIRCKDGSTKGIRLWHNSSEDGSRRTLLFDIATSAECDNGQKVAHDRLLASIECLPDATFVIDNEKKVVAWNRAIEEMTGTKKSELIGKGNYAYSVPFYGEPRPMLIDLVGVPNEELEATYTCVERRSGTIFGENFVPSLRGSKGAHLLGSASFLYDNDGNVVGAIESVKDITERKKQEEDLQFRNVLLSTQQETSLDGILVVDEESHIISYNRRFVELWGIPAKLIEDGADEPVLQFFTSQMADPQPFLQRVLCLYEHRKEASRDELLLADGRIFDCYSAPMIGPNDRDYGRIWYFRDMTGYKQAQMALKTSEEKFRSVFEQSHVGLVICAPSGEILSMNKAYMDMLGYEPEELRQMTYQDLTPEKWQHSERDIIEEQVMKGGAFLTYEKEYIHKDGHPFPVSVRAWVTRDGQGQVQYLMGWVYDITDRKRAEEALREREETFRALAENSPDVIVRFDRQYRHLYANPKLEELTGIPVHQFAGKTLKELDYSEDLSEFLEAGVATVFSTGTIQRKEAQLPTGVWIHSLFMPECSADGTVKAVVMSARDITEVKEAEVEHARTNSRLSAWVQELEDNSRDAAILSEMADFLQTCRTTEEAYKVVTHSARRLFPTDSGAVCAVSASRNIVEAVSVWGDSFESERVFAPDDCWALRRGKAHHVSHIDSGLLCDHLGHPPDGGYLCVPMMAHGETLGVLHVRTESMRLLEGPVFERLTESKRSLAVAMAEHIALALANLRLRETLHRQAIRDPLTSLYNRRHMEESLEREVHRAIRRGAPLSVVMLDLDHFKQFNDTFGHSAGDALLQELGTYFQENIRGEDLACRFGGEEFVLILPDATAEDAAARMEHLLSGMHKIRVEYRGQPLATTTFSAGVACLPHHGSRGDALLQSADCALYRAKVLGRKQVVIADAHLSLRAERDVSVEVVEASRAAKS